jgi:hypothetical protein
LLDNVQGLGESALISGLGVLNKARSGSMMVTKAVICREHCLVGEIGGNAASGRFMHCRMVFFSFSFPRGSAVLLRSGGPVEDVESLSWIMPSRSVTDCLTFESLVFILD